MAYSALISLMNTIERLVNSSRISIVTPGREVLDFACNEAESLVKALESLELTANPSEKVKALEGQIRDAAFKLEDVIESHVSNQFHTQSESVVDEGHSLILSLDVQEDVDCFTHTAMKLEEEYLKEISNPLPDEDVVPVSVTTDFGGNLSNMVGLSDEFCEIRDWIAVGYFATSVVAIVGMAGIGKTALAKKIFEDPKILSNFDSRFFVTLGPKSYKAEEIQKAIVNQVFPERVLQGDEDLNELFSRCLRGRYLIVLDDLWNADCCDDFLDIIPEVGEYPNVILVTTRLQEVSRNIYSKFTCDMRFLNEAESWDLFCGKVFPQESCPPQLVKPGKKIAKNCEGLPLLILTVADLLSKDEKTLEYWNKIAANKDNAVFVAAYDQILEVLYPSYHYTPPLLKACFLYMGAFPQDYKVRCSRLINLWSVEGFLEPHINEHLKSVLTNCLGSLVACNLVLNHPQSCPYHLKVFSLHSVFWHLCRKEARNSKFLHTLNHYSDGFVQGIDSQRRLSIYKNSLFAIKDVHNSMASSSTARSLFCAGAYHQYQVPICSDLRLLRVLDALTIRFYEFPLKVVKLDRLRHLSLTYNGDLPPAISKLWKLESLIVNPHLSIISTVAQTYLPIEIWDLQELKYLQIMGRNLPDPPPGTVLRNLSKLVHVGAQSCTKAVLESIPNLKKLGVQIALTPNASEVLRCFDHISHFVKLKSLKCVIVNPILRPEVVAPLPSYSIFPPILKKLTLSGMGYPWEEMARIASLPKLQMLKLRGCAFRGPKWQVEEKGFPNLKLLVIEDADLVQWTVGDRAFQYLWFLTMKNCYNLQVFPKRLRLNVIRLVDCNPSALAWAKEMETDKCRVYAHSSWVDGDLKP